MSVGRRKARAAEPDRSLEATSSAQELGAGGLHASFAASCDELHSIAELVHYLRTVDTTATSCLSLRILSRLCSLALLRRLDGWNESKVQQQETKGIND